jgi:hypothetical protein
VIGSGLIALRQTLSAEMCCHDIKPYLNSTCNGEILLIIGISIISLR